MEPANAWERAQEAIARAEERNASVVTPDNAVSPFDASATMIIPQAGTGPSPRRRPAPGDRRPPHPPAPRRPADGGIEEPPTMPVEVSDPGMYTVRPVRPPTSPFPASSDDDGDGAGPEDDAGTGRGRPAPAPRNRPRWRRLFRRS